MRGQNPLADHDFVGPDHAQYRPRLFVQQVEVKIVIRQAVGQVFHPHHIAFQHVKLVFKRIGFGHDLGAAKHAKIPLHGGKGEIKPQHDHAEKI